MKVASDAACDVVLTAHLHSRQHTRCSQGSLKASCPSWIGDDLHRCHETAAVNIGALFCWL